MAIMKHCVIGNGFIATALKKALGEYSWYPTDDTEVVFYMGGVTHMDFNKNPNYHGSLGILEFAGILGYCRTKNIHLIYPSSALVYEPDTDFSEFKKEMEHYGNSYEKALGVRMFPVYGPGENKTVISKWCKEM